MVNNVTSETTNEDFQEVREVKKTCKEERVYSYDEAIDLAGKYHKPCYCVH